MTRRELIGLLVSVVAGFSVAAAAEQPAGMRHIAVMMGYAEGDQEGQTFADAFRKELQQLGWIEGRTIRIDFRWVSPRDSELRQRVARELIALQPDLILSHGTPVTATLLQQTRTIPIIFVNVADPVGSGFVASFNRPGGNATGLTNIEPTMAAKWLEMIKEIAPRVTRVAFLFNPSAAPYAEYYLAPFKAGAASLGLQEIDAPVHDTSELESIMAGQAAVPNSGLVVMPDTFMSSNRMPITSLAARYQLPTIYPFRFFAEAGGLLSYGSETADNFRRAATYANQVLKGENPAELPVQLPVKFELVINLKTAKALGITIPPSLLATADEVIE